MSDKENIEMKYDYIFIYISFFIASRTDLIVIFHGRFSILSSIFYDHIVTMSFIFKGKWRTKRKWSTFSRIKSYRQPWLYKVVLSTISHVRVSLSQEEFEDTKGVIRIRHSMKDRQHIGQKKKDKQWSTKHTHKTKDRVTRTPLKTRGWTHKVFGFCGTDCILGSFVRISKFFSFYLDIQMYIHLYKLIQEFDSDQ